MTAVVPQLPDYLPLPPDPSRTPRSRINGNSSTAQERRANVAAEGTPVPIIYGRDQVRALIGPVTQSGGDWIVLCIWCHGGRAGIDAIEQVTTGGKSTEGRVTWTHYLGTSDQGVDPTLAAAIPGYSDTLAFVRAGVPTAFAYSVARYPTTEGFLRFEATVRGLKVHDPRDLAQDAETPSTWVYSDNAGLALSDFESSRLYGRARTVDWDSVATLATACDELLVDGSRRRRINLTLLRPATTQSWIDVLRTYAGAILVSEGGSTEFVADRPAAVTRTITAADIIQGSARPSLRGLGQSPTVVTIWYTDTRGEQWSDRPARAYAPGVSEGTTPWRESVIRLPGIDSYAQAYREALERLNYGLLVDADLQFDARDASLQDQEGDVVDILLPQFGPSAKPFRILKVQTGSPGTWRIWAEEYQPGVYSDDVAAEPTYQDTTLPDPQAVPEVTDVSAVEEHFKRRDGTWATRFRITWSANDYPYSHRYDVRVSNASGTYWEGNTPGAEAVTGELEDLTTYTIDVRIVGELTGTVGPWSAPYQVLAQGDYLIPGDVPQAAASQIAADAIEVSWHEAVDAWQYSVRWGAVGVTWDDATPHDLVDGLRTTISGLETGQYDVLVRTRDSVKEESANATRCTVTVAPPVAPASLAGYESGGVVRLSWPAGTGYINAYEIRYGQTGGDVATATVLDQRNALTLENDTIPVGTWRFYVLSVDPAGNYSTGYAYKDISVDVDADAFLVDTHLHTMASVINAAPYTYYLDDGSTKTYYVTDTGETALDRWPDSPASYVNPLYSYHAAAASEWLSDEWDAGQALTGNWTVETNPDLVIAGNVTVYLELSEDGLAWYPYANGVAKRTARYVRVRISADGGGSFNVKYVTSRIDAVTTNENGRVIASSTGPIKVVLANNYSKAKNIRLTPVGEGDLTATVDNVFTGELLQGFEDWEFNEWTVPTGNSLSASTDAYEGEQAGLVGYAGAANPSSGGATGGIYLAIPTSIEEELSGHEITVIVRAKQPSSNASAEFALAYSTNEVGNSNWQVFTPTAQWQEFSFTYNVPPLIAGGLDYLGIWGDTSNSGLEVLIDAVMIRCDTSNDVFEVNRYKAGVRDAGPVLWDFEGV